MGEVTKKSLIYVVFKKVTMGIWAMLGLKAMEPMFSAQKIRHCYSLIPVMVVTGGAVVMAATYGVYFATCKPDVKWVPCKHGEEPPWQHNANHVYKVYEAKKNTDYDPAIIQLRKEVGSYSE